MAKNKKRANEGEGAGSASPPPLKRQKIIAASSSTAVSDDTAAQILQLQQRLQSAEEENARLQKQVEMVGKSSSLANVRYMYNSFQLYGQSWNGKTTDIDIIDNLTRLSPLAIHYNANVTNQFIRDVPEMLWWQKILQPFLNLEDLSILRCTNTFFQLYWESVLQQ